MRDGDHGTEALNGVPILALAERDVESDARVLALACGRAPSTEKIAAVLRMPLRDAHALSVDPEFRAALDKFVTLRYLTYERRESQIRTLYNMSVKGRSDAAKLAAFDVLSRQAGLKVPDRQEISEHQAIEVTIKRLASSDNRNAVGESYVAPVSRRERLGEVIAAPQEPLAALPSGPAFGGPGVATEGPPGGPLETSEDSE